jgi:hypothetical protein
MGAPMSEEQQYAKFEMIYRVSITKLDNDHLKPEPFIPFLEKVSSAIDDALVQIVPQGRGIVSIELLEEEKVEVA